MLAAVQIAIQRIGVRHDSPRYVDDALIERMASSLSLAGQLQPISVRRAGEGWVLIFGYVRLHAARRLGWETIWAVVHPEIKKQEHVDLVLWAMDNLHHATPELDELAVAVKRMADAGMSDSVIAVALNKTVDWVNGLLEIAQNPLARNLIDSGRLVSVDDWIVYTKLELDVQTRLLNEPGPITRQTCEQAKISGNGCKAFRTSVKRKQEIPEPADLFGFVKDEQKSKHPKRLNHEENEGINECR